MPKYLDATGVQYLWEKISMEDYPNNETLMAVINAIDETKANKSDYSPISLEEIDDICGASIVAASEVKF